MQNIVLDKYGTSETFSVKYLPKSGNHLSPKSARFERLSLCTRIKERREGGTIILKRTGNRKWKPMMISVIGIGLDSLVLRRLFWFDLGTVLFTADATGFFNKKSS